MFALKWAGQFLETVIGQDVTLGNSWKSPLRGLFSQIWEDPLSYREIKWG